MWGVGMNKYLGFLLGTLLGFLVFGVVVSAVSGISSRIPASVQVVYPEYLDLPETDKPERSMGFYWKADGKQSVKEIKFDRLATGQTATVSFYIKNEGNIGYTVDGWSQFIQDTIPSKVGQLTLKFSGNGSYFLRPGEIVPVQAILQISPSAPPGEYDFSVVVTARG